VRSTWPRKRSPTPRPSARPRSDRDVGEDELTALVRTTPSCGRRS
jgi:hypothetical protein